MSEFPHAGDAMPDIALEGADGMPVRASDFRGRKLIVFFYPKDDTPGCTTENIEFSAMAKAFAQTDTALLGVSKDSPAKHAKFAAKHSLTVPLASDALENGLADALGIWLMKSLYGRKFLGMERSTYLVDRDGTIARVWRKVKVNGHAAEVLEAARALA
ncbi:MAG: peroxiredoxin [Croceibacterium sp.]